MAGGNVEVAGRVALAPAAAGAAPAQYWRTVWRCRARFCARYAPVATRRPPTSQTLAHASSPGPQHSTRRARGGRYSTVAGVPCVAAIDAAKPKVCRPAHAPHSHWSKSHSHAPLHAQVGNARRRPSTRRPRSRPPTAGAAAGVLRHALCRCVRGCATERGRTRRSRWCVVAQFGVLAQFLRLSAAGRTGGAGQWGHDPAPVWPPPVHVRSVCTLVQ